MGLFPVPWAALRRTQARLQRDELGEPFAGTFVLCRHGDWRFRTEFRSSTALPLFTSATIACFSFDSHA